MALQSAQWQRHKISRKPLPGILKGSEGYLTNPVSHTETAANGGIVWFLISFVCIIEESAVVNKFPVKSFSKALAPEEKLKWEKSFKVSGMFTFDTKQVSNP